jgi:hypothetical protein
VSGFRYWLGEPASECAPGLASNRSQIRLPPGKFPHYGVGGIWASPGVSASGGRDRSIPLGAFQASFQTGVIQASNRTGRAAMSILKNYDARARFSVGRSKSQHPCRSAGQPGKVNSSGAGPEKTQVNRLTFAEDFTLEHCRSGRRIAMIGIWGGAETAPKEPQPSTQSFGFPS